MLIRGTYLPYKFSFINYFDNYSIIVLLCNPMYSIFRHYLLDPQASLDGHRVCGITNVKSLL